MIKYSEHVLNVHIMQDLTRGAPDPFRYSEATSRYHIRVQRSRKTAELAILYLLVGKSPKNKTYSRAT